jgi:hypothetical protein
VLNKFLSPPPPEEMWVNFLIWCAIGVLVQDIILFGVTVGDWELFSPATFPFYLYDSLVLSIVSRSLVSQAGVPKSLSPSSFRIVLIK